MQLRHINREKYGHEIIDRECVVCGLIQNEWDYYQLHCLHYAHTRCIRHWIVAKNKLSCPWCQENTPQGKQYCSKCKIWTNHTNGDDICPYMIQFYEENPYIALISGRYQ